MKLIYLVILFISIGCSQYKIETNLNTSKEDVLSKESFLRYSDKRIEKAKKNNINLTGVAECHNNNIRTGQNLLKFDLEKNKDNPDYWNQVGICFYLDHQFSKAEYFYQLSLQTAKKRRLKFASAHNNLGVIYLRQRHFELAFNEFTKSVRINNKFQTPKYNLAHLYLQFGQNQKALNDFKSLLRMSPSDPGILAGVATAYTLLGDLKKGLKYFSKIPKSFLSRPDVGTHYAMALYLTKNYEKAYEILKNRNPTQIKSIRKTGKRLLKLIEDELENEAEDQKVVQRQKG